MIENGQVMAIMKSVGIGMRDVPYPCLWFTAMTDESGGSLQILNWPQAEELIKDTGIYDVRRLEGKPCVVDISEPGLVRFVRVMKIRD